MLPTARVQLRADMDRTSNSASHIVHADIPIRTVVTRHTSGDYNFDHFSHWTKSI
ncbi:hypothetical protein FG05_35292 [Fusarium graminearum]|nr:hypothetical protein FG05_35292 [Fusarium graminearum]